jgi:hypothetical protein
LARQRFGLAPFRSPLLRPLLTSSGYVRCFSSPAYLQLDYVFIQRSQGSPPCGVPPFGDPRLPARARLPEAFRCYATSFFGTNDLGIHPTPSVTVSRRPAQGRPRRPRSVSRTHTPHILRHPQPHSRACPCFALVLAPLFVRSSRSRPRLLPDDHQAANDDIDRKRIGGDEETRTPDPLRAKEVLSQLSYIPMGRIWWAIVDSNHRPHPYQGCALTN